MKPVVAASSLTHLNYSLDVVSGTPARLNASIRTEGGHEGAAAYKRHVLQLRGYPDDPSAASCAGVALRPIAKRAYGEVGFWRQTAAAAEMACPEGALVLVCPQMPRGQMVQVDVVF